MAIFLSLTTFTLILLLQPPDPLAQFFEVKSLWDQTEEESVFRYYLLLFPFVHIITAVLVEVSRRGGLIDERRQEENRMEIN